MGDHARPSPRNSTIPATSSPAPTPDHPLCNAFSWCTGHHTPDWPSHYGEATTFTLEDTTVDIQITMFDAGHPSVSVHMREQEFAEAIDLPPHAAEALGRLLRGLAELGSQHVSALGTTLITLSQQAFAASQSTPETSLSFPSLSTDVLSPTPSSSTPSTPRLAPTTTDATLLTTTIPVDTADPTSPTVEVSHDHRRPRVILTLGSPPAEPGKHHRGQRAELTLDEAHRLAEALRHEAALALSARQNRRFTEQTGQDHPAWCIIALHNPATMCWCHYAEGLHLAATAGPYEANDSGASFPRLEVYAAEQVDGTPTVTVSINAPDGWVETQLRPEEARALATALIAYPDSARIAG